MLGEREKYTVFYEGYGIMSLIFRFILCYGAHMSTSPVEVTVLGQVLRLGCPTEQHEFLRCAAQELDDRVVKMKERTGILSMERLLSIVALNLAFELMQAQQKHKNVEHIIAKRIQQLDSSLERINTQKIPESQNN